MDEETLWTGRVDPSYWDRLLQTHPTEVCDRTEAVYHPRHEGFVLPVYHQRYLILPKVRNMLRMEWDDKVVKEDLTFFFVLMVLVYLVEAKDVKPTYRWVSGKDLKGGSTFFRGPHELSMGKLEDLYGEDPEGFLRTGEALGGHEMLYGDKAFALQVFPKMPLAYVLWTGDEEFQPRIGVLFDSTIQDHFNLDGIWCMVSETSRRLVQALASSRSRMEKGSSMGRSG